MSSLKDKIAAQRKQIADNKAAFQRSYRFKVGKTMIRVMPGTDDPEDFAIEYGAHYLKDPRDNDKLLAVVGDAEICYGKVDPVRQAITDFVHRCNERGDEQMAKNAKGWLAKRNHVMNIKVIGGADTENAGKVVPWEASENQYDSVLSVIETALDAGQDPFDMNGGLVLVVERTGTGVQDTKYTFQPFLNSAKYPATQADLDARHDLKAYRDGKFGTSVTKALGVMSSLLGYDVTTTALGASIAASVPSQAIAGPGATSTPGPSDVTDFSTTASTPAAAPAAASATSSIDEDLLALDATFEDVAPAAAPEVTQAQAAPAASVQDDILAELDAL